MTEFRCFRVNDECGNDNYDLTPFDALHAADTAVQHGFLRVDIEEYLRVRAGMERVAGGESIANVAGDVGVAASTLRELYNDRPDLYLRGETNDDRVDAALEDIHPLGDPAFEPAEDLNKRLERLEKKVENFAEYSTQ